MDLPIETESSDPDCGIEWLRDVIDLEVWLRLQIGDGAGNFLGCD